MQVLLAGYNIDTQAIELIRQIIDEYSHGNQDSVRFHELLKSLSEEPLSPETISAAYAKISRSSKGIRELRRDSRASVSRARRSNENIVFGLGHASIAEHAVFNLDFTGISRLAMEALESHRLASYTESSQRYISMADDFIIPDEIINVGLEHQFSDYCTAQFGSYSELEEKLFAFHSDMPEKERTGKALEDARYVLPLACRGQAGVTINARVAESMVKSFYQDRLHEVRFMGRQLHEELRGIAPSLVKYTEPNPLLEASNRHLAEFASSIDPETAAIPGEEVILLSYPEDGDDIVTAAMVFCSESCSFYQALQAVRKLDDQSKKRLIAQAHSYIGEHDTVRRELELATFTFSITLSSSAFAQLKRHRMATLSKQNYDVRLGYTIPPHIHDADCVAMFEESLARSLEMYQIIREILAGVSSDAAQYALTNAHRRKVIFQANAREMTHFSRLREDKHAQWDIRNIATKMVQLAREACPGIMQFACGKDSFATMRKSVFS